MALRGKKPTEIKKRLKALFYGPAGVGKTTAAIQFPNPYLIDTERGAENKQYVDILEKNNGVIFQTGDFDELITEVKALLTEKHEFKTLIIDPLTNLYNDLLDKSAIKNGTEFGRHYGDANKRIKHLISLLYRLDMNVIITSHAKNEYGANLQVLGQTYDCYKKLDYIFDITLEIQKRARDRVAVVKKTRLEGFPEGDIFPFSYDEIARRYDRAILEKDSQSVALASPEQVKNIIHLIDIIKMPEEAYAKWLDKAGASSFEEMAADEIDKCIKFLMKKIQVPSESNGIVVATPLKEKQSQEVYN